MWGSRVVIPTKLRTEVLQTLHEAHVGVVRMKALARSYVWWPGIDSDIEGLAKGCSGCQQTQHAPKCSPLHPWEWPSTPWQRIHIDFAGPFLGLMFLVVVDAHSKWPEAIIMNGNTTALKTVEALRTVFARNGVPEQLVSDNGPQFTAEEFQLFLKNNGVKHITSAPYHPATNGLAERFVQMLNRSLTSMKEDPGSTQTKLSKFLMKYRNTPHSTTGETPATLFMGRKLRTRLDLIKPDIRKHVTDKQVGQAKPKGAIASNVRQLFIGQTVSVRNYRGKEKWIQGIVRARTGPLSYRIEVAPNVIWRRHIDQLLASDNSNMPNNTRDWEPEVTHIPPLADENDIENEITVDVQEQNGLPGLDQREEQVETDEEPGELPDQQRYPGRIRQEPVRLGFDR